ncbi:MAG: bifunctional fucokinase/fucose-1-phosphate guanylyltransferase [Terracidiphilus sp.]|nr:bifunctional fucokinase/fucose-1-phosphate guanylyltransferase [Terracidiphilus sp.]
MEIERRNLAGTLPQGTEFLVVPDPGGRRVGSGGATIHALGVLGRDQNWWQNNRVFLIHSGGDSRRLPQYSPLGKLFGVLPSRTTPRATTTVFDETLDLSAAWAERIPNGLLVASGDVLLHFDAAQVQLDRPGVTGVAMLLDAETGSHHGVYVVGEDSRVYTFLQKPTPAAVKAAGGMQPDGRVAVDIGLLRFDPDLASALTELAGFRTLPAVDLYDQITRGLTGEWKPEPDAGLFWRELARILRDPSQPAGFHCSVVEGEFIHAGTTRSFRDIAASAGGLLDSVVAKGCSVGHEAVVLECDLEGPVNAARGAILHGLTQLDGPIEVPANTVVHQLPIAGEARQWIMRTYGVEDDPKQPFATATWFNRPLTESLDRLGVSAEDIWNAGVEQTLWNAALFPTTTPAEAWNCARWMMGYSSGYTIERWRSSRRLSLAASAQCADSRVLAEAHNRRLQGLWRETAIELVESGTDIRPLLANLPGIGPAAEAGRTLRARALELRNSGNEDLTLAASRLMQAARLLTRSGHPLDAAAAEEEAFACVRGAVRAGVVSSSHPLRPWCAKRIIVSAPARIDLGGGWSDTPPFCFDWGGTVLNCALEIDGAYPIRTEIRRIAEPLVRCIAEGHDAVDEYRTAEELLAPCGPGSVFSIPRAALTLSGLATQGQSLEETLTALGGGIEIRCQVRLPLGSGLGTSSILSATVVDALARFSGNILDEASLSDVVSELEQQMTTGGGWQDQAGGIFPDAKLLITGPGLRQRIRVQPVAWSQERRAQFESRMVLVNTGIQRMAKDLLRQVVSRYLSRETATIQVLHSIKTLAIEMSYALAEGDWKHLGELLNRHWHLNQILDPHTTNAPIEELLGRARPWIYGAKLAGAGGGGFLILLARDPDAASELRRALSGNAFAGANPVPYRIAEEPFHVLVE